MAREKRTIVKSYNRTLLADLRHFSNLLVKLRLVFIVNVFAISLYSNTLMSHEHSVKLSNNKYLEKINKQLYT